MAERAHPNDPGFQGDSIYKEKMFQRYEWCNQFIKDKDVLDIPCGCGWGTYQLKGYRTCYGMDICMEAIEFARMHYDKRGRCEFVREDMLSFYGEDVNHPSNRKYDVIICMEGYEHVEQTVGLKFLENVQKALRPGGLLLMTCPVLSPEGKHSGNPYHLYEPDETDLMMIVSSRFRVISIERQEFPDNPIYRMVLQRR